MVQSPSIRLRPRRSIASPLEAPVVLLFLLGALAPPPAAADLDAVFVLDTTGSMSAEIREVQERVWDLAGSLASARAGERIRFGVVAYRDRGDAYVTRLSPLTEDVETSRRFLAALSAGGGGDGPESVIAALAEALAKPGWDISPGTDRQIFLVGDAPPHLDYGGEPTPEALIEIARRGRIVINTIGCRSLPATGVAFFRRIAYATEGSYQHIGRLQAATSGALTEAMTRAAASGREALPDDGPAIGASWLRHEEAGAGPATGILVRQGGPKGSEQSPRGDGLLPCTLEVRLPSGLALGRDPEVRLGAGGLDVGLELAAGDGGTDWFALDTCPALSTPVHVLVTGGR